MPSESGEPTRPACWRWRPRHRELFFSKSITARRRNGHARARTLPGEEAELLRSAQHSSHHRSDALTQMGAARFIITIEKRADPNHSGKLQTRSSNALSK